MGIPTQQNEDGPIQQAVDGLLIGLTSKPTTSPPRFLAVHFACGTIGEPGYIVRTAATAKDCPLVVWAQAAKARQEQSHDGPKFSNEQEVHRRVIVEHARNFHRSETLLNLLSQLAAASGKNVVLNITTVTSEKALPLRVTKPNSENTSDFLITLSSQLATILVPSQLVDYLKKLYDRVPIPSNENLDDGVTNQFHLPRAHAFGFILERQKNWAAEVDKLEGFEASLLLSPPGKLWRLLGPLQSTLLYSGASLSTDDQKNQTLSAFSWAVGLKGLPACGNTTHVGKYPCCYVFGCPIPTCEPHALVDDIQHPLLQDEKLRNHLATAQRKQVEELLLRTMRFNSASSEADMQQVQKAIANNLDGLAPLPGQRERLNLIILWLCLLAQRLLGAKHEGHSMDFWFVAGERSEFADDRDVCLNKSPLHTRVEDVRNQFRIPDDTEGAPNLGPVLKSVSLEKVVHLIEKEHFPWFSRGQHALFYDISDDGIRPCGLAELRVGAWQRVVGESFKLPTEQQIDIPACALVYVDGSTGEAGLILCRPKSWKKEGEGKPCVQRILRLKGGKWQGAEDERQTTLLRLIKDRAALPEDRAKLVSQIAVLVADDPHAGGMLVFVNNEAAANAFLRLGEPWDFTAQIHDRIPLIAHDGATLLWTEPKNGYKLRWAHRKLMTPDGNFEAYRQDLERLALSLKEGFPLTAVGTRRWSAALTALRENVQLVVVISTDGGMTCWWREPNASSGEVKLWYQSLSVGKKPDEPKWEVLTTSKA